MGSRSVFDYDTLNVDCSVFAKIADSSMRLVTGYAANREHDVTRKRMKPVFTLEFKHKGKVAIVCQYLNEGTKTPRTSEYWYTEVEKSDFDLAVIETTFSESYTKAIGA